MLSLTATLINPSRYGIWGHDLDISTKPFKREEDRSRKAVI